MKKVNSSKPLLISLKITSVGFGIALTLFKISLSGSTKSSSPIPKIHYTYLTMMKIGTVARLKKCKN